MRTIRYDTNKLYEALLGDFPLPAMSDTSKDDIIKVIFDWYIQERLDQDFDNFTNDLDLMITDLEVDKEGFTSPITLLDFLCKKGYITSIAVDDYFYEIATKRTDMGMKAVVIAKRDAIGGSSFQGNILKMIDHLVERKVTTVVMNVNVLIDRHGSIVNEFIQRYLDKRCITKVDE